jgi:4-hydroxybenzoate polyprenyltransferase
MASEFSAKQWVAAAALFFMGTSLAMVYHKVPFYIGGYTTIAAIVCLLAAAIVIRWRVHGYSGNKQGAN